MLMKICAKCGKKLQQGEQCSCQKSRHKLYNAERRDQAKNQFYHSQEWANLVSVVKVRANGIDEYALAQGYFEIGNTVHHIYTIDERPDLKLSPENLIYLSSKNHSRIHREYAKDSASREILQAKLVGIIRRNNNRKI